MKHLNSLTSRILILLLLSSLFAACTKYDDGPMISLRSKKERIDNVWKVDKAHINGIDVTTDFASIVISINRSGKFNMVDGLDMVSGKWSFVSDKEKLKMEYEDGNIEFWEITKLKEKEFSFAMYNGGDKMEVDLVEK